MSVLAVLEHNAGEWHPASNEALTGAQQLARDLAKPAAAVLMGNGLADLAAGAAAKKLDRVHVVEHELLENYTADGYAAALQAVIEKLRPEIVVFPHTYQVRDYAPRVATRFRQVLVSDVVRCRIDGESPVFVRQLFQGKLLADVRVEGPAPWFVSLQAGAFRSGDVEAGQAAVEPFAIDLDASAIRAKPSAAFRESEGAVDLTAAGSIVAVGRGVADESDLEMLRELAGELGAEIAASRPVCDNGWLPMERQVGSSGQTVAPKLYVAIGVSGAIQHLVGMKGSKTIVAVNKDPEAPIFEVADYGIAGDLYEVVPALIEELKKAKS